SPVMVAAAVAVAGVLAMVVVDHGPWSRPHPEAANLANHGSVDEAARAAGATVTPTEPKSDVEPAVAGPKRAQPVSPGAP
ncbi:MAG TPA: hypothetical protein VGC82_06630, partial [Rhodopila sp.]